MHEFYQAPGSHALANDTVTIGFLKAQASTLCHIPDLGFRYITLCGSRWIRILAQ